MEEPIISLQPSKKAAFIPFIFRDLAGVMLVLLFFSVIFLPMGTILLGLGAPGLVGSGAAVLVVFLGYIYSILLVIRSHEYRFYDDRIEVSRGVMDKKEKSIMYDEITNINKWQNLYGRFFGTATIDVHTAGEDGKIMKRGFIDQERDVRPEMQLEFIGEYDELFEILNSRISNPEYVEGRESPGKITQTLRPSFKAALLPKLVVGVFTGVVVTVWMIYQEGTGMQIAAIMGALFGFGTFFIRIMNLWTRTYTFDSNKVDINEGFLNRKSDTISYDRITDVTLSKPVLQRIFGTGTIHINTAGSTHQVFSISYIENPEETHQKVSDIVSKVKYRPSH